jgi:uncharacterized protein YbjQ (UPF0145 family)
VAGATNKVSAGTSGMTAEGAMIVTTTNEVAGYRVRSRSVIGNIGAGIQSLFGGNITIYTNLAEKAREEAFNLMVEHAASAGGNAVIAMPMRSPTASPRCWPTARR